MDKNTKIKMFSVLLGSAGLIVIMGLISFFLWEGRLKNEDSHKNTHTITETKAGHALSPQTPPRPSTSKAAGRLALESATGPDHPEIKELKEFDDLDALPKDMTLREYIHSLYYKFRNAKGREDFFRQLRDYLMETLPADTAEKFLKVYEAYMDCELRVQKRLPTYAVPKNEEDMIYIADDLYAFRVEQLGEELAKRLYGHEHKTMKYKILNKKIYDDDSLYGAEKEQQLQLLASEIFGEEANENVYDKTGESLYREKLELYKKDFAEMSEQEKKLKKREFRLEYLSPQDVDNIEAAEAVSAAERQKDLDYNEKSQSVFNNPNLRPEEKQEKIRKIQEEIYGARADEIRRGEEYAREHNLEMKKTLESRGKP